MSRYDGAPVNGKYRWGEQSYAVDRGGQGSDINQYTQEETPLDLQVNGQMSGMGDGYYELETQPSGPTGAPASENPWYETDPKWVGKYKTNSGEDNEGPQAPLPKAPSHQAIMQQYPGWQPMQYAITREYSKQYASVLNPRPVIGEEEDWGGTMLSAEQLDYARAKRNLMAMPGSPVQTQDPYGNYDEITGAQIYTPATGMYGLVGMDAFSVPATNLVTPIERKRLTAALAVRYVKQLLPKVVQTLRRRGMSGLGQDSGGEAPTTGARQATASTTPTTDWGKILASAVNTIAPAAIAYATKRIDTAANIPGGVQQLRVELQQAPPVASAIPWETIALIGGGVLAVVFVLPKVMGR